MKAALDLLALGDVGDGADPASERTGRPGIE